MNEISTLVSILHNIGNEYWLIGLGLSLRELIHEFKYQTLVLFKCCLLQPKVYLPCNIMYFETDLP